MPLQRTVVGLAVAAASAAMLAPGCSSPPAIGDSGVGVLKEIVGDPNAVAVARLEPVAGSFVGGRVSFSQYGSIVIVRADVNGLPGGSTHGLHVHEKGDCRSADGTAAGGHFNPNGTPHGRPGRGAHHAGDLPNLQVDGEGNVLYSYETNALSVVGGPLNIIGRSVIVSRGKDDYSTQPDGNSGPPLACGFIRIEGGAFGLPIK